MQQQVPAKEPRLVWQEIVQNKQNYCKPQVCFIQVIGIALSSLMCYMVLSRKKTSIVNSRLHRMNLGLSNLGLVI